MSTSLETGYWNYASRWQYPDEHADTGIIPERVPEPELEYEDLVDEKQQTLDGTQTEAWGNASTQILSSPSGSPKESKYRSGSPTFRAQSPTVSSPTGGNYRSNMSPTFSRPESPSFLPPIPSRPSLVADSESHYTEQFSTTFIQGLPEKNVIPGGLRVPRRRRGRGKAPASFLNHHLDPRYYESQIEREKATPTELASRLWGRINPAYCVVPYMTSSQRDFQNWKTASTVPMEEINPMETRFNLKVHRKDFKEEMAKEKRRLAGAAD